MLYANVFWEKLKILLNIKCDGPVTIVPGNRAAEPGLFFG